MPDVRHFHLVLFSFCLKDLDLGFQKGLSKYRMSLTFPKTEGVKRSGFGLNVVSTVICCVFLFYLLSVSLLRFGLVGL